MIKHDMMYDICKSEVVLNFNTHNEEEQKEKALDECTPSILQQLRLHTKFMQSERETKKRRLREGVRKGGEYE